MFCKTNASNPNKLISTAFASTARTLNQAYSSTVAGEPVESGLSDSSVVERLRKLEVQLDSAIINEETDVALQVLEEMRGVPVTLNSLKVSNAVKLLRKQRKQGCGKAIGKGIDVTISAWEQRTMELAKRRVVPIKSSAKRECGSSAHGTKRGCIGSAKRLSDSAKRVSDSPQRTNYSPQHTSNDLPHHLTMHPPRNPPSKSPDTTIPPSDLQIEDIDRSKVMDDLVRQILDSSHSRVCGIPFQSQVSSKPIDFGCTIQSLAL